MEATCDMEVDTDYDTAMSDAEPENANANLKRSGSPLETPESRRRKIDELEAQHRREVVKTCEEINEEQNESFRGGSKQASS